MRSKRPDLPSDYDFYDNPTPTESNYSVVNYNGCFFRFGFGLDEKEGTPVQGSEYELTDTAKKISHFYWRVN